MVKVLLQFLCGCILQEVQQYIHCLTCGKTPHQACIQIQTAGKQDFIEESEGMFNQDQWPDAFAWFSMRIKCTSCGLVTSEWVSYETM